MGRIQINNLRNIAHSTRTMHNNWSYYNIDNLLCTPIYFFYALFSIQSASSNATRRRGGSSQNLRDAQSSSSSFTGNGKYSSEHNDRHSAERATRLVSWRRITLLILAIVVHNIPGVYMPTINFISFFYTLFLHINVFINFICYYYLFRSADHSYYPVAGLII